MKYGRNKKTIILDEVDKKIIRTLQEDCLTPFVNIARKLSVTEGTIRHRVKKLANNGIIKRFTVATDPIMLGLHALAFVIVNIHPGRLQHVAQEIAKISSVLEVHEIHTYGDLLLKIRASDLSETANILSNQIKTIDGVANSQVISVLNVWKDEVIPSL